MIVVDPPLGEALDEQVEQVVDAGGVGGEG